MDYFAQQLINGLVLGSIYGLIAIGYTMVYGIVGMIKLQMSGEQEEAPMQLHQNRPPRDQSHTCCSTRCSAS